MIELNGDLQKRLRPAMSSVFATNAFTAALNFFVLIYFVRILAPQTVADYALILLGIELAFLVFNFGFNQVLIFHGRLLPDVVAAVIWLTTLLMFIVSIATYAVWFAYASIDSSTAARLFGPGLWLLVARVISLWSTIALTPLEVHFRYGAISRIRAAAALVGAAIGVITANSGGEVLSFVYRDLFSAFICLAVGLFSSVTHMHLRATKEAFVTVWQYSRKMWALNLLERAALRIEYLIVASQLGHEVLGAYFAIRSIIEGILGFFVNPIQTVLFAYYCRANLNGRIPAGTWYSLPLCVFLGAAGYALNLAFGDVLIASVLGADYGIVVQVLGGLIFYGVCALWFENVKVLSMSMQRHTVGVPARLAQIFVLLIGLPIAAQQLGLPGVGFVLAGSGFVLASVSTALLTRSSRALLVAK